MGVNFMLFALYQRRDNLFSQIVHQVNYYGHTPVQWLGCKTKELPLRSIK